MKSFVQTLPLAAALFSSASLAWGPSCAWDSCVSEWSGADCTASNGWDCLCSNATAITNLNSCVASSCTAVSDQEAVYGVIAQVCANEGVSVTAAPEATFSATSGGSAWPSHTGSGPWGGASGWSSWYAALSTALPGAPNGWHGGGPWNGAGGQGGHGYGYDHACSGPWSTWSGPWGASSQWTGVWSACSTATSSPVPATITTTVNGQVVTGTTFGVQALSTAASTSTSSTGDASNVRGLSVMGVVAGAVGVAMVAL